MQSRAQVTLIGSRVYRLQTYCPSDELSYLLIYVYLLISRNLKASDLTGVKCFVID